MHLKAVVEERPMALRSQYKNAQLLKSWLGCFALIITCEKHRLNVQAVEGVKQFPICCQEIRIKRFLLKQCLSSHRKSQNQKNQPHGHTVRELGNSCSLSASRRLLGSLYWLQPASLIKPVTTSLQALALATRASRNQDTTSASLCLTVLLIFKNPTRKILSYLSSARKKLNNGGKLPGICPRVLPLKYALKSTGGLLKIPLSGLHSQRL